MRFNTNTYPIAITDYFLFASSNLLAIFLVHSLTAISVHLPYEIMAKFSNSITEKQKAFIEEQHMFFVATSPTQTEGRINLSPKGLDCFRVLDANTVAYLDLTGSGNETAAHVYQNGRITFMFCSFQEAPNILRLYGQGEVILPGSFEWKALIPSFTLLPGTRQIIKATITQTQDSCGFAVPFMSFEGDRTQLTSWAENMGDEKLDSYRLKKNSASIDGIKIPLNSV